MPLVPFNDLMADAERSNYAVGYFESWNLESLLAVADAAESVRSPVLLGFSGIYLPHPGRLREDPLDPYAALGLEVCRGLSVPAALVYNESPSMESVMQAVDLGFSLVMYSDDAIPPESLEERVRAVADRAHRSGGAVEGETAALPGLWGEEGGDDEGLLTSAGEAGEFVEATGVDAFAVNIGQAHLHGRGEVELDFDRLRTLRAALSVPLVMHGATSVSREDLRQAVEFGIRKVNIGSRLKQVYFSALQEACSRVEAGYNPYEVVGSGLQPDVLMKARTAMQAVVEELMAALGSAGRA